MTVTLQFGSAQPARRQHRRAGLQVEALEERWLLTGRVRLTLNHDRFWQPVSVIACGPAVLTALMFTSPWNPGSPHHGAPRGQGEPGQMTQSAVTTPQSGAPPFAPAQVTLTQIVGAEPLLPDELVEVVGKSWAATAPQAGLLPG